jgi:hypothetical protein
MLDLSLADWAENDDRERDSFARIPLIRAFSSLVYDRVRTPSMGGVCGVWRRMDPLEELPSVSERARVPGEGVEGRDRTGMEIGVDRGVIASALASVL